MPLSISYTLCPRFPEAHLFEVTCTLEGASFPDGQSFSLPAWIPGSYMIRDFARHIVLMEAEIRRFGGNPKKLNITKLDKSTWKVAPCEGALTLRYRVYALDLSVREAYLDNRRAFCNGTSVFVLPLGLEGEPCVVNILPPPKEQQWRVATSLPSDPKTPPFSFGLYRAKNYEDLIDHPIEMGEFEPLAFPVSGAPHYIVMTGNPKVEENRLERDLMRICTCQKSMFGKPFLKEPYYFLVNAAGQGYGGLEHRNSTALLCEYTDLPLHPLENSQYPEGYLRFLRLCSHEYFHRWFVKRIRPAALMGQNGESERYTRLLWLFEGVTSYYDDLFLYRAGLIDEARYLGLLGKTITQVQKTPGRHFQSLEEASFDAWIKYYRPNENTPNASVSYYQKGALVALCLDLALRDASENRISLDTLMRSLWRHYHQASRKKNAEGMGEEDFLAHLLNLDSYYTSCQPTKIPFGGPHSGRAFNLGFFRKRLGIVARWLEETVSGTKEMPLYLYLGRFGVKLEWLPDSTLPWTGFQAAEENGALKLSHVRSGSPAEKAGLMAGDLLIALNGQRVGSKNLDRLLASFHIGQTVNCHYFRHDLIRSGSLTLGKPLSETARLTALPGNTQAQKRKLWLW